MYQLQNIIFYLVFVMQSLVTKVKFKEKNISFPFTVGINNCKITLSTRELVQVKILLHSALQQILKTKTNK